MNEDKNGHVPKYTLVAICDCCGEVNEIEYGCNLKKLNEKKSIIEVELNYFEGEPETQRVYEEMGVSDSKHLMEYVNELYTKTECQVKGSNPTLTLLSLNEMIKLTTIENFLSITPKWYGHVIEVRDYKP